MEKVILATKIIYDNIFKRVSREPRTKKELEKETNDDDVYTMKQRNNTVHRIVIYGSEDSVISDKFGTQGICKMCFYVVQAQVSVDVCVPSLASKDVAAALVCAATRHGMKIRIAIHKSSDFCNLPLLSQNGVEVKVISSELLEHDFILIDVLSDVNALAIIGSIDYDIHRFNSNKNHQVITSEPCVIRSLKDEFERVWNSNSFFQT